MTTANLKQQISSILPALRRFALSLCGNVADADDLLQTTVERLLTRSVPDNAELIAWAFKVCRNAWIDEHRARKVRENAIHNEQLQESTSADDVQRIHDQMALHQVDAALEQLAPDQREAIALVAIQGLSYREAAEILEVPTGTIMSRLARARSKLVSLLQPSQVADGTSSKGGTPYVH
ncbi:RNA polymerase sigma factor [Pseudidiomarina marina]|uniref:RNA polymerase subunit sigma-70 n=1 Tax=Pseudidiomarina marina TaxID=502366 RepID=A0A432YE48_9GAMM|nr:RNA polymerase sigma factor [Pseudidiomarina marina]PHR65161.1 MAG: RNA polymerase subunit sigma-70 [Idiomarina sp.]RUO59132.1 RNA polymerase subunit sigma-70 [Pseudidiomarina marina]